MDTIPKLFWKRLEKMSLDEERIFILFDLEMTPWQNEVENWVRIPRLFLEFLLIPNFDPIERKINSAIFSFFSLKWIKIVDQ